ncbi:unnamed protein product [Thlaspi arvense]|uniref:Uncharacterized protein n=1 Tax=Thlaspi arvense TaxID=13288 RepID=A0AAU9R7H7_THLAR|nr:unnamed protein product [Thlaspi arvense]
MGTNFQNSISFSDLVVVGGNIKVKESLAPRLKITILKFNNTEFINVYSRTLIGRCINLGVQDIGSLFLILPRIWKVEDRVAGADLGTGRFQFDFDEEENIKAVLQMELFHFDGWMVVIMDPNYPSALTFLGSSSDNYDGFKELIFEFSVAFYSSDETTVILRYERLHGFCRECFRLCHETEKFPRLYPKRKQREEFRHKAEILSGEAKIYKRAFGHSGGVNDGQATLKTNHTDLVNGKGKVMTHREEKRETINGGNRTRHGGENTVEFRMSTRHT